MQLSNVSCPSTLAYTLAHTLKWLLYAGPQLLLGFTLHWDLLCLTGWTHPGLVVGKGRRVNLASCRPGTIRVYMSSSMLSSRHNPLSLASPFVPPPPFPAACHPHIAWRDGQSLGHKQPDHSPTGCSCSVQPFPRDPEFVKYPSYSRTQPVGC